MTEVVVGRTAELLDAAVAEFIEKGYRAVGVREITERADVSHGTFYNYFDSKRHLLSVLIDRDLSILLDKLTEAAELLDDPVTVGGLRAAVQHVNREVPRYSGGRARAECSTSSWIRISSTRRGSRICWASSRGW